jgi:hypothetical protein
MTGIQVKTINHTIDAYWPLYNSVKDDSVSRQVALWISKNEKVLNKQRPFEVCRLLAEQFSELSLVEVRGAHGWLGRLAR